MTMNVKTILFVENDPVALTMYRNRLEREGFHLQTAQDGLEALKAIAQITPDLVVLDMMLPKLSGDDVIRFVRADPRLKSLPIVIFSNAPLTDLPQEISATGLTRHLIKTDSTFPMLLQTIQDLLALTTTAGTDETAQTSAPAIQTQAPSSQVGAPAPTSSEPVRIDPAAPGLGKAPPVLAGAGERVRAEQGTPQEATSKCAAFMSEALAEVPKIRELCLAYIKAPASPTSLQHLPNLYQRVRSMSTNAANVGCARIALLTLAFDALLSEIMVKPSWVTPSILQTIAQAADCLGQLLTSSESALTQPMPPVKVLAVDDDMVCNHVMMTTLKRAKFAANCVENPHAALELLQTNQYDLVFLDINMPDMTGFELCAKLRQIPHCKSTPVIFITGHNNFDNRKQSVLSGGHDFITKPVSPSELALKATLHLLKNRTARAPTAHTDTQRISAQGPVDTAPAVNQTPAAVAPSGESSLPALPPAVPRTPALDPAIAQEKPAPPLDPPTSPIEDPVRIDEETAASPTPSATVDVAASTGPQTAPEPIAVVPPNQPSTVVPSPALEPAPLQAIEPPAASLAPAPSQTDQPALNETTVATPPPAAQPAPEPPAAAPPGEPSIAVASPAPEPVPAEAVDQPAQFAPPAEPAQPPPPSNPEPSSIVPALIDGPEGLLVPALPEANIEPAATVEPEAQPVTPAEIGQPQETREIPGAAESLPPAAESSTSPAEAASAPDMVLPTASSSSSRAQDDAAPPPEVPNATELLRPDERSVAEPAFNVVASPTETGTTNASEPVEESDNSLLSLGALIAPPDLDGSPPLQAVASTEQFDRIAVVVAKIMFGDDHLTERHLRLVRLALEHYNLDEILEDPAANPPERSQNLAV